MQPVVYRRRSSSVPRGEREWRVEADALVTRGVSGRERRLPWREIAGVRLYAEPARNRPWRYVFEIRPKQGDRIAIDNAHFCARGAFEDRSAAYTPFVRAALQHIASANPAARALMAETQVRYFLLLLAALLSFCALALALILVRTPFDALSWSGLAKLGLIVVMLPVFARWVLGSLPRGVPLDQVPARVLPPERELMEPDAARSDPA